MFLNEDQCIFKCFFFNDELSYLLKCMQDKKYIVSLVHLFPFHNFLKFDICMITVQMENDIIEQQMHDLNAYSIASRRCLIRFQHFLEMVKVYGN